MINLITHYSELHLLFFFFLRVLRRLVTLITQLAKEISNKGVLKIQAENTNKAAKKFMEENEKLKLVFNFLYKNHVDAINVHKEKCTIFSIRSSVFIIYQEKVTDHSIDLRSDYFCCCLLCFGETPCR